MLDSYRADVTKAPDKSRFIFAYTNLDVAELNKGAREVQRQLGRLGADHELETADGRLAFAAGDRIQFTKTDKKLGFDNGSAGTVRHIENGRVFAELDGGEVIGFDSAAYRNFRHGYAGTIYKGQGDTVDQAYLYHSEHWRSAASYVGMTRHREKAELFAATNTAGNLDELARQMARIDEGKRYAASMFHHRQEIDPVRPFTAAEIRRALRRPGICAETQQQQDEREARRSAAGGDMGYSHGGYASQSDAALRDHERRQRRQQQGSSAEDEKEPQQPANQNRHEITREAIERDPWNAVALDLPADADHELLFLVAGTARDLQSNLAGRGNEALTPEQQQLWFDLAEQAKERQSAAETQIVALDAAPQAKAEPLTLDDIAERVQRIIDDPTREAEEQDESVLLALNERRAADLTAAAQVAATAADDEQRIAATAAGDEPEATATSADEAVEAVEEAASSQELTDDGQVQYSRSTGGLIGAAGRSTTGRSHGGRGRSRTR